MNYFVLSVTYERNVNLKDINFQYYLSDGHIYDLVLVNNDTGMDYSGFVLPLELPLFYYIQIYCFIYVPRKIENHVWNVMSKR